MTIQKKSLLSSLNTTKKAIVASNSAEETPSVGRAKTGKVIVGHIKTGKVMIGRVRSGKVMVGHVRTGGR